VEKHWSHFCTLSVVHFMAYQECLGGDEPIVETVSQIAADPFFDAIEIGWIKDPDTRAATKAVLDTSHMQIGHAAQSALLRQQLNLNSFNGAKRSKAVGQLKANIDKAAEIVRSGLLFYRQRLRRCSSSRSVGGTRQFRQGGVRLRCRQRHRTHLRNLHRVIDKKCLIGPSDSAADFAQAIRVNYPDFGLLYDLSHQPLLFEQSEPALTLLQDHLVHAHVGNCVVDPNTPGYGDLHLRFGWPGGCNDVDELVELSARCSRLAT